MLIDTGFDVRTDSNGKDPDTYSPTLRHYHRSLWNKMLPNGQKMELDEFLNCTIDGDFFQLSSDSISNSYRGQKRYQHIISQINKKDIDEFYDAGCTVGGYIVFPRNRIDNRNTINQERGINNKICDRFDLTLECIRLYYLNRYSPLYDCLRRYDSFFRLFVDFKGYVDFFLLQDLVDEEYKSIRFFTDFDDFVDMPMPKTKEEYLRYKNNTVSFVKSRNKRIEEYILNKEKEERIECRFADISEHDMDMLFLEEFVSSDSFLKIFLSKAEIEDARVISVESSKTDIGLGESDMTVIIEDRGKKIGFLIEDKIDAIAMPDQYKRYVLRGNKGIENGDYDSYHVFIVAPEKYLCTNKEAEKYPYKVTYESIADYFGKQGDQRANFKLQQIRFAIEKQKTGYQIIEDARVTDFWKKYAEYQKKNYPGLLLIYKDGAKGHNAAWPRFNTVISRLYMYHKTEKGFIDLTFDGCGNRILLIENMLAKHDEEYLKKGFTVQRTQKSAAIRLEVPALDIHKNFDDQIEKIKECFDSIQKMADLVKLFDQSAVICILDNTFDANSL